MTDTFARRTGLVALGQAAMKATQLILAVVLVRLLDSSEWNEAAFLLSIYVAAVTVGTLNVHHGIAYFLPRTEVTLRRALVAQNVGLLLSIGCLLGVCLMIAAPAISGGRLGGEARLSWLGLAVAMELPSACTTMTLIATQRFVGAAIWDTAGAVIFVGATVVPVVSGAGVDGVVAGLVVAGGVRLLASIVVFRRLLAGRLRGLPRGMLAMQLRYALPLGATITVSILNRLIDKWFIAAFNSGDFGIYAVAAQEVPMLAVLPYAGGAALMSALVDAFRVGDVGLARTHWVHLTMTMSVIVVPMSMALILIAPELLTIVFTTEFAAGVLPFQLFTVVTLHRVAEYGMLLRAAGRGRDLVEVAAITLGANVVFAGLGAAFGGMAGASLGTLLASAIGWAFAMKKIARVLQASVREAFAWRAWISSVVIATGAAAVAWTIQSPLPVGQAGHLVAKLIVFTGLYYGGVKRWRRSPHSRPPEAIVVPRQTMLVTGVGAGSWC